MQPAQEHALQNLLSRRSAWPLTAPAPSTDELAVILQAAASAPDHASLQPWHFKVVEEHKRAELLQKVLAHPDAQTEEVQALKGKYALKLTTAPLVIVMAVRVTPHPKAPEFEQLLTVGAAAMNMLNAAWALGYSGFWSSTPEPLGGLLHQIMEFAPQDKLVGLLNLGTPTRLPKTPPARAAWQQYAEIWQPTKV